MPDHPYLLVLLALLGVASAIPGGWGLTLVIDNRSRRSRAFGLVLLAISLPTTAGFYSWASYGDPLWALRSATWGMILGVG